MPFRLLADFKGTLQTDGYEGYAATAARDDILHAAPVVVMTEATLLKLSDVTQFLNVAA